MAVGSLSSASAAAQYAVAVDKKQLDVAKQQGESALKLIQSAAPANVPAGVRNSLNIVA